jgi:hypothetical protein
MFQLDKNWIEFWSVIFMILGLALALFTSSAVINYLLIFVSGMFGGRIIFERQHKIVFPYYVMIAAFLFGYLLGMKYGNGYMASVLFISGGLLNFKLLQKNIIGDTRY